MSFDYAIFIPNSCHATTIADKIYETMSKNQAKWERTKKLLYLFFDHSWPLVPKFYLYKGDQVLGSDSFHSWDFSLISYNLYA